MNKFVNMMRAEEAMCRLLRDPLNPLHAPETTWDAWSVTEKDWQACREAFAAMLDVLTRMRQWDMLTGKGVSGDYKFWKGEIENAIAKAGGVE